MESKSHYPIRPLESLCEKITVGLATSVTPFVRENGVQLIRNQNIRPNLFRKEDILFVDPSFANKQKSKSVLAHDVITVRTGSNIGESCVVPQDFNGAMTFTTLISRPKKDALHSEYLAQYLNSPYGRQEIQRLMVGGGKGNLNAGDLKNLQVIFPPYSQQINIANCLSTWDIAIGKTGQQIQAKEKRLDWLVMSLINKAGYEKNHISFVVNEVSVRNRNNAIQQVLSVTNRNGFVLPEEQFERRVASENLENYKVVKRGQYAYNPSRINVGSIARLDNWDEGVLSPMYTVFELDESKINSDYFLHWLSSREAKGRIRLSAQGSVRETVNFKDFGSILIPLPDLNEQTKVAEVLNTARKEIDLLKKLADAHKLQKRGLMQKLLTGEWRVSKEVA